MSQVLAALNQKYSVNRAGQYEVLTRALYDHQIYPDTGGIAALTFFGNPYTSQGRSQSDTNMEAAGTLPSPQQFLVQSIAITIRPGVLLNSQHYANDVDVLGNLGVLVMSVGSKEYVTEAPINRFPADTRLSVNQSGPAAAAFAVNVGRAYKIRPIMLMPTQNFSVRIHFPNAPALPSGEDARIGVYLNGELYRLSQ